MNKISKSRQVPFASRSGGVACPLHSVGKGLFLKVALGVVAPLRIAHRVQVTPRNQSHPSRMTNRRGIEVIELHALPGKPVDVRRGVRFTTITADRFTPHVIGKDQDDVRTIFPKGCVQQRGKGKLAAYKCSADSSL